MLTPNVVQTSLKTKVKQKGRYGNAVVDGDTRQAKKELLQDPFSDVAWLTLSVSCYIVIISLKRKRRTVGFH